MNQKNYYNLISGQRKNFFANIFYLILIGASAIYSLVIRLRNFFYDRRILAIYHAKATVISIGNITAGGTGKTPLVAWICNEITADQRQKSKDYRPAILTRGYKTTQNHVQSKAEEWKLKTQNYIDEPAVLAENCPNAHVIINPDRVAGASKAIREFSANVLVMDDGFQHRRLARDLDIITIDATCPFGYNRMLPAGLLREHLSSLKRAQAIVITRCSQVSEAQLKQIEENLLNINPNILITRSIHQPVHIKTIDNRQISLNEFKNRKVFAFCGIGNPDSFINSLKNMSYNIIGSKIFNDHYGYTDNCMTEIQKLAQNLDADIILTTQKDWTKICLLKSVQNMPLAYVAIEIKFLTGEDELRCLIENTLEGKII